MRQMKTSEKPRDVSGVELLMNNHQVRYKAKIGLLSSLLEVVLV